MDRNVCLCALSKKCWKLLVPLNKTKYKCIERINIVRPVILLHHVGPLNDVHEVLCTMQP